MVNYENFISCLIDIRDASRDTDSIYDTPKIKYIRVELLDYNGKVYYKYTFCPKETDNSDGLFIITACPTDIDSNEGSRQIVGSLNLTKDECVITTEKIDRISGINDSMIFISPDGISYSVEDYSITYTKSSNSITLILRCISITTD